MSGPTAADARAGHLAELVAAKDLAALYVSDLLNIRYLTGFAGTNGACLVGPELRRIFEGPLWNYVCLESDLVEPGDYRTAFVGEMPVIVVRGEGGEIHAFEIFAGVPAS